MCGFEAVCACVHFTILMFIFGKRTVCEYMCVYACVSECDPLLSRYRIFRQLLSRCSHLLAGGLHVFIMCVYVLCSCVCMRSFAVKIPYLSAASVKMFSSFGRRTSCVYYVCVCVV